VQFRNGTFKPFATPKFDGAKISVNAFLQDRDGNLWVATTNSGLYRIYADVVDHFGAQDGLSSNTVLNLYEDQEGIIWAATSSGLDSFQEPPVTTYSAMEGLGADEAVSVTASHDGTVWLANAGSLDSIRNGTVLSIGMKDGLPGHQVTSLLEDREGNLWVGVDDGLFIYKNRHFRRVPGPDRSPIGMVVGITEDVDGNIWVECASKPRKLVRIRDFKVQEEFSDSQVPPGHSLALDPKGGIWLGTLDGRLVSFRKGTIDMFPMNLKDDPAVRQIEVQQDGSVIAAAVGDGLITLRDGVVQRLTKQNGLPCTGVIGFARDNNKNWWLDTPCGYVELTDLEIQKWRVDPKAVLQFRFLDALDGARTGEVPFNPAVKSPDERLWFVSGIVAQTIDPTRLAKESSVRQVYVESVTADRMQYAPQDSLTLPALTRDIQIDYTSPSFSVPKKVKFRYRLEGNDSNWQDAGTRRQAFYTNLRPGQYRFMVIASNDDGVWNMQGATLQFTVAPAWFQTIWFRTLSVVGFFLLLWSLYHRRLRQVRHEFNVSLEARVNERTRIARDLHDTLLQTLHGLLMSFQRAANLLPERPVEAKQRLEGAIDQAAQAITEGREAVQGLRSSAVVTNDLALAIQTLGEELAVKQTTQNPPLLNVAVEGTLRDLNPILRDDVYRIAGEALRNAFHHAQARRVEVDIGGYTL
jgi:ligand-binding sensor domain-containing protein